MLPALDDLLLLLDWRHLDDGLLLAQAADLLDDADLLDGTLDDLLLDAVAMAMAMAVIPSTPTPTAPRPW